MKPVRSFWCLFAGVSLVLSALSVRGDDTNYGRPLTQVRFDRLVPTSYPTIQPNFARLRPTTEPLIHPGIPQVPITEGLTDSFAKPLLITSERPEPFLTTTSTTYRPIPPPRVIRNPVQPKLSMPSITHPSSRPASAKPAKANNKQLDNQQR
jgi:hypothetical protein